MQKLSKPADWILPVPFTFTKGIYRCGVSRGALPHTRQILSPTEWGTCYLYGRQVQCISSEVNRPIIFRYLAAAQVSYVGTCGIICKCISHATFTLTGGPERLVDILCTYLYVFTHRLSTYLGTQVDTCQPVWETSYQAYVGPYSVYLSDTSCSDVRIFVRKACKYIIIPSFLREEWGCIGERDRPYGF